MKGLTLAKVGAPFELVSDVEKPTPGPKQVLAKSLYAGINPVETYQMGGLLVHSWPIVIGCDASGEVVEVGEGVTKLKKGDAVFGCTKLGVPGCGTFQEYFLIDEHLAFLKPDNISLEEGATVGVGALTSSLGLIAGLGLRLPKKGEHPKVDEWVIILGGSGGVGQFAVQIAKRCGYKVLSTCSPANEALVKRMGADATLNYKLNQATQLSHIESLTSGNFSGVLDTTASSAASALDFLSQASKSSHPKRFSTVDDWSQIDTPADITAYRIMLGSIGQSGPEAEAITADIAGYIPFLEDYLAEGSVKPLGVQLVGEGLEAVPEAIKVQTAGNKGGQKIVVKIQDL